MRIRVIKAPPVGAVCAPALPEGGVRAGAALSGPPPGLLWVKLGGQRVGKRTG